MYTHIYTHLHKHVFTYSIHKEFIGGSYDHILHWTAKAQRDCPRSPTVGRRQGQPDLTLLVLTSPVLSQAGDFYSTTVHQLVQSLLVGKYPSRKSLFAWVLINIRVFWELNIIPVKLQRATASHIYIKSCDQQSPALTSHRHASSLYTGLLCPFAKGS